MNRINTSGVLLLLLCGCMGACSSSGEEPAREKTYIHGQITVDEELSTTSDFSGIELLITQAGLTGEWNDTLFVARTDSAGFFGADAEFDRRSLYSMLVNRNNNTLAILDVVLAAGDTVHIEGELPEIQTNADVSSSENDLMVLYDRLDRGVGRIFQYANLGIVTGDTLEAEINKWSDLFWDFYNEYEDSFAGELAARTSVDLLEGWNDDVMIQRLDTLVSRNPGFIPFASEVGATYHANTGNYDRALRYLDSLSERELDDRIAMRLQMSRIKLQYDSARVDAAKEGLREFRERYTDHREAVVWLDRFEYDLTALAAGSPVPPFEFVTFAGDTVTHESLTGQAYMLELTRLDNSLYQQQYERGLAIYQIYNNYGIQFLTVPFVANDVVVDAFFEERLRLWPIARPGSFNPDSLREAFNINMVPTRILVDRQGNVVRKYEGTEFADIISGLRQVINPNTEEPL
ncbi:MAG: hypothetical protein WD355_01410 [Balneolaceae bacterium]